MEENDLIEISISNRVLRIVGVNGERKSEEEMEAILKERKSRWQSRENKYTKGVLKQFAEKGRVSDEGRLYGIGAAGKQ